MGHYVIGTRKASKRIAALILTALGLGAVADSAETSHWDFTTDPHWEGLNNVPKRENYKTTVQEFGYSATNFNGLKGEIGGKITRSMTP